MSMAPSNSDGNAGGCVDAAERGDARGDSIDANGLTESHGCQIQRIAERAHERYRTVDLVCRSCAASSRSSSVSDGSSGASSTIDARW